MTIAPVLFALAPLLSGAGVLDANDAAAASLDVRTAGECPTARAVLAELDRVAGAGPAGAGLAGVAPAGTRGDVDIAEDAGGLRIRLRRSPGAPVGERRIETVPDCGERAAAAAVVIATWQAELRSPVDLELPSVARGTTVKIGQLPAPPSSSWRWSLGAAALGAASAADVWTGGAAVDAQATHRAGWGARLTLWGIAFRSEPLGDGAARVRWARWGVGIGPSIDAHFGEAVVSASAQLALAQIIVKGEGLSRTRGDATFDAGARAALEIGWRRGAVVPFAGVGAAAWPRRQEAVALGVDGARRLPWLDVLLSVGVRFGRAR